MVKLNTMNMMTEVKSLFQKRFKKRIQNFLFSKTGNFFGRARVRGYDTKDIAKL